MPDTLGRYRIAGEIGRGAIGVVYRAIDPVLERTVALKMLNPELAPDIVAEMKARFVREARSAGKLNHPNIVTVYDADVAGDVAYIAMEYLEGHSLQQLLDAKRAFPLEAVADIVAQVAEGLDYAGRFGIVHRDIKPANIMVSPAGVAKITDFGLAHVPTSSMTQAGDVLGSPKYICPEQVLEQPIDPRADIFSLGVVLFELLAGKTPFEAADLPLFELLERIAKQPAPRPSELRPGLPAAFDAIVARALAKQPQERFRRAADMARELRALRALPEGLQFPPDAEPSGEPRESRDSLSKLLAQLESFSRGQAADAEAANELSARLRKGYHYLSELVRQVIQARPAFVVQLDLAHVGALPPASLGEGAVDCGMRTVGEAQVVDRVTLRFRMHSHRRSRIALDPAEARQLKAHLQRTGLRFESREVRDETGRVQCEAFVVDVDVAAQAVLRGDYEAQAVEIECLNVGVLGPARYRLTAGEFDDAIWEFGKLLLGFPSRFAGLRLPLAEDPATRGESP